MYFEEIMILFGSDIFFKNTKNGITETIYDFLIYLLVTSLSITKTLKIKFNKLYFLYQDESLLNNANE